jgi:hypothetical protein
MSKGIAHRRGAKAARRKKLLAERRKFARAEANIPLAERARRSSRLPIRACLVQEGMFEAGLGTVLLARGAPGEPLVLASFIVDVLCLGVKDAFFRQDEAAELQDIIDMLGTAAPVRDADPSYARKLLRDAVAYARSLGFEPHEDYAAAELLFGEARAEACDVEFHFGRDGKPVYMPGLDDSAARIRRVVEQLRRRLGPDAFEYLLPADDLSDELADDDDGLDEFIDAADEPDELDGLPRYDPALAPDPKEWLELDEDTRQLSIENYHRRAGVDLPNERLHAAVHLVIENQSALGDELPVRRTIERLMAEGLDRHDAIHAVSTVFTDFMIDIQKPEVRNRMQDNYYEAG